jgi:hypothetical protein
MNFITTNHRGGIGNVMFKIAAVISLSMDNNVDYKLSNEFIRQSDKDYATNGYDDYRIHYYNVLRHIKFVDKLDFSYNIYKEPTFDYTSIPYQQDTNLLLDGYFQSELYFINNKQHIIDLYKPQETTKTALLNIYPEISKATSIHVRRGDYLNFPDHHPQQSIEYYKSAIDIIGYNEPYIIFSDDLDGCKTMFNFLPNKVFFTTKINWIDMYIMSLCKNNIICNSTFSWWGAYLNETPNTQIIAPNVWFGSAYKYDTSTIIPQNWTKL